MHFEDQQKALTKQTKPQNQKDYSQQKTGTRSLLSQKQSKRAFSKRLEEISTYKAEEGDRNSVQNQVMSMKMGKSHVSSKHKTKDMNMLFQKNISRLMVSKNLQKNLQKKK